MDDCNWNISTVHVYVENHSYLQILKIALVSMAKFIVMRPLHPPLLWIQATESSSPGRGPSQVLLSTTYCKRAFLDPGLILALLSWYDFVWLPQMIFPEDLSAVSWFLVIHSLLQIAPCFLASGESSAALGGTTFILIPPNWLPTTTTRKQKLYYWYLLISLTPEHSHT